MNAGRDLHGARPDRMQVAQLVLSDALAGTERHVALLSRELTALGARVRLICGTENSSLLQDLAGAAVDVRPVSLGRATLPAHWGLAHAVVTGWRPDVVHAHLGNSLLCAALLCASGPPLRFTQHFVRPAYLGAHGPRRLARVAAHRLVHRRVAAALAPSHVVLRRMVAIEGFPAIGTTVVPHGIDVDDVKSRGRDSGGVRAELGLPPDAEIIVTPARLEPEKGHATLLAAMSLLTLKHPNASVLLAGEGSLHDSIKARAARLGIGSRVHLLGQRGDVPRLLAESTLCVLPSYEESFGLVLLEAMALARPVVACRAGGPQDIVVHGETGLLVPPRHPEAMAVAIGQLLEDPHRADAMGLAGQRRVDAHFTSRRMAEGTLRLYETVLHERYERRALL